MPTKHTLSFELLITSNCPPLAEQVTFKVVWKKNNYNVTFALDKKAIRLKEHIQTLTGMS